MPHTSTPITAHSTCSSHRQPADTLLLIDAGNTRIKWAMADRNTKPEAGMTWRCMGSVTHPELSALETDWQKYVVQDIWISNVAGPSVRALLEQLCAKVFPQASCHWLTSREELAGLRNAYRQPAQLGGDRFISAIGAHALFPQQDLIVATCGTATTVDAVSGAGTFSGGMILPGLQLMAGSLAKNTAQLPQVAGHTDMAQIFADNTDQAIVSGCIHAQTGAIMLACESWTRQTGKPVLCLISGGAAPYLIPHLTVRHQHIPNLVLTGLLVVAQSRPD
ncbi:type III pantothenate kinase [Undibacterium oligocarboniphilum]|uniref:Type III pantothenate kinase n=2 Tax=Undibacterium oligocarboniphilum TaxID=666702 RepID=A0A850QND5_9BURK|nr:type III pantothenate kinase [Undibacterium oligocarboniphilum]NVO79185.1 type III pantothenate kinase [Undibacterium oligocarboniphilum]